MFFYPLVEERPLKDVQEMLQRTHQKPNKKHDYILGLKMKRIVKDRILHK